MKWRQKGPALLLTLLLGTGLLTLPAAAEEEAPTLPAVTIEVREVADSEAVEVSLRVDAPEELPYQAVETTLWYDATALRPIRWDAAGTEVPVETEPWRTALHTMAPGGVAGKPALGYANGDGEDGLVYLAAESYAGALESGAWTVTLRMQKIGALTGEAPVKLTAENLADYLTLAPPAIAAEGPALFPAAVTLGDGTRYALGDAEGMDPRFTAMAPAQVVWTLTSGPTHYPSETALGGAYAITFFDWDGRVIDAITAPEDAREAVAAWQKKQEEDPDSPLNAKAGYDFDQWLAVRQGDGALVTENGTFPSNAEALDLTNPKVKEDVADFKAVSTYTDEGSVSVLVQAAYKANDTLNNGPTDASASHYSITPTAYTRYGDALPDDGKFSITLTVERANRAGCGVTRAVRPGVVVKMQPAAGGQPVYTLVELENTDVTACEVVPNKQIASVEYYFIDVNDAPDNWPGAGNRSPLDVSIPKDGTDGFQSLCTVGYINQLALDSGVADAAWAVQLNAQTFQDAGLTYSDIGAARTALRAAIQAAGAPLDRTQMQAAIGGS